MIEKNIVLGDEAGDWLGNRTLKNNGQGIADFVFRAGPQRAEGEDLFELIEDEVRDLGRFLAPV